MIFSPIEQILSRLRCQNGRFFVVKSNLFSILQHECYSWEIKGGDFVHVDEITSHSKFIDSTIKHYLSDMTKDERIDFVDTVFGLLGTGGADQLFDLLHPKNIGAIVKTLGSDEKKRNYLLEECRELLRSAYATKQNLTND